NLAARAWMRTLCEHLEHGLILVIDYGFPRGEYYHPQRATGTLMCHHRHTAHADPFARPGDEDITAHVDFSALAGAARAAGADVLGFATQAQFLVNCGITEVLGQANVENALVYAPLAGRDGRAVQGARRWTWDHRSPARLCPWRSLACAIAPCSSSFLQRHCMR